LDTLLVQTQLEGYRMDRMPLAVMRMNTSRMAPEGSLIIREGKVLTQQQHLHHFEAIKESNVLVIRELQARYFTMETSRGA
jgi:hypothetical protein